MFFGPLQSFARVFVLVFGFGPAGDGTSSDRPFPAVGSGLPLVARFATCADMRRAGWSHGVRAAPGPSSPRPLFPVGGSPGSGFLPSPALRSGPFPGVRPAGFPAGRSTSWRSLPSSRERAVYRRNDRLDYDGDGVACGDSDRWLDRARRASSSGRH